MQMEVFMLGPIYSFQPVVSSDGLINKEGLSLCHDPSIFPRYFNIESLKKPFGSILIDNLLSDPFFAYHGYFDDNEHILGYSEYVQDEIDAICTSFWFIKDNCITSKELFVIPVNHRCTYKVRDFMYSTAKGTYEKVTFTEDELKQARVYYDYFKKTRIPVSDVPQPILFNIGEKIQPGTVDEVIFNKLTRISRSILFLQQARATTFLPLKIAFYIQLLECLFSANDNVEINHKIAERVAWYLGGEGTEKVTNYDFVREMYGIRSKFVHGQMLENKHIKPGTSQQSQTS
ncbi:hypothetical protein GCM10027299_46690 [Larkinella ripae]